MNIKNKNECGELHSTFFYISVTTRETIKNLVLKNNIWISF